MHYIAVRGGQKEKGKNRQNKFKYCGFPFLQYTSTLYRCIQNFKTLAIIGADKSVMKNLIGKNEKCINRGNDKHDDANSFLHITTCHTQCCTKLQNPRCSSS